MLNARYSLQMCQAECVPNAHLTEYLVAEHGLGVRLIEEGKRYQSLIN